MLRMRQNTFERNPSSDRPPNTFFSAQSLYGSEDHGLKYATQKEKVMQRKIENEYICHKA
jgi:hypothetical protein